MGRSKAFDPQATLDKALMLFWQQGYEATSMADLEKTLGINKFSIYNTYGNKEALFLQALDRYVEQRFTPLLSILHQTERGLMAIETFFDMLTMGMTHQESPSGCFVAASGTELGESQPLVRQKVLWVYGQLEDGFYRCLEAALQSGQLSSQLSLQDMSRFLVVQSQGISAIARIQTDQRLLTSNLSFLKQTLQQWAAV